MKEAGDAELSDKLTGSLTKLVDWAAGEAS